MDILEEYRESLAEIIALDLDKKIMMTVDPNSKLLDTLTHQTVNLRSNIMDDYEFVGDVGHEGEELEDPRTLRNFISNLEAFLDGELDEDSRGNVFMTESGDGVSLNILVGAPFEDCDEEIKQINIIISPTDRSLLGSTGVSMDDREYFGYDEDEDDEEDTRHEAFDEALSIIEE
ncbi:hypothetical protein LCGC14_1482580 [marine sediment metagenome]|uniref:Uncharacterized protein n=1 Tax=marine sediment metagenome TaxID=412755 RepID=A0A0F9J959_9ZZZZ